MGWNKTEHEKGCGKTPYSDRTLFYQYMVHLNQIAL